MEHQEGYGLVSIRGREREVAAVHVDAGAATRVVHADFAGNGAAKGHAEFADLCEIARAGDGGDGLRWSVLQRVVQEFAVGHPDFRALGGDAGSAFQREFLEGEHALEALVERVAPKCIGLRGASRLVGRGLREVDVHGRDIAVREGGVSRVVGVLDRVGDVTMARQFFHQDGVLVEVRRVAVAVDHHRQVRGAGQERSIGVRVGPYVTDVGEEGLEADERANRARRALCFGIREIGSGLAACDVARRIPHANEEAARFVGFGLEDAFPARVVDLECADADGVLA